MRWAILYKALLTYIKIGYGAAAPAIQNMLQPVISPMQAPPGQRSRSSHFKSARPVGVNVNRTALLGTLEAHCRRQNHRPTSTGPAQPAAGPARGGLQRRL